MDDLYLFSAVTGTVLDNGAAVGDAEVVRTYTWAWKDTTGTDRTRTDAAGRFSLPAITGTSVTGALLPHEPVVTQEIVIHHQGSVYKAWSFTKHNYRNNGELGRALRLTCRLEDPPVFHGEVFGICTAD